MSLRWKFILLFLPATALFLAGLAFFSRREAEDIALEVVESSSLAIAAAQAEDSASALGSPSGKRLQAVLHKLQKSTGALYAAAMGPAGRILAHTNVRQAGRMPSDTGLLRSLKSLVPGSWRAETPTGQIMQIAIPLWAPEKGPARAKGEARQRLATLSIGLPIRPPWVGRIARRQALLATAFALALLGLVLLFLQRISRALRELARATQRIGAGEHDLALPVRTTDELGQLARSFNAMSAALRQTTVSKEALDAVIESAADGILVVDRVGRMTHHNRRFAAMWRVPRSVLESRDDNKVLEFVLDQVKAPQEFLAKVLALYADCEAESSDTIEFRDGRVFERASRPQRVGGRVVGRVWSFRDATEARRASEVLQRQAAELSRSNDDLRQFAHAASHDLKEPLRMVASYTELLSRRYRGRLDADADEFIGYASEGAIRMEELLNDLLTYVGVDAVSEPSSSVDLNDACDGALDNLKLSIAETSCAVTRGELPTVRGDLSQITELFQNLIDNAIKFRGEGPPNVAISARRVEGVWEFALKDDGIGIEPRHFERIFVIFRRLHARDKYPGTGMGLALCKRIVERHGGRIWVESEPGRGACFRFTLPDAVEAGGPS